MTRNEQIGLIIEEAIALANNGEYNWLEKQDTIQEILGLFEEEV
jgi:hypothetical protein